MEGKLIRMSGALQMRRQQVRILFLPPPALVGVGLYTSSVIWLTAGKDLLRRRVNTVAKRKSATLDSRTDGPPVSGLPAVIRSIGVEVTHLPSKQLSPVRVRYAPPWRKPP